MGLEEKKKEKKECNINEKQELRKIMKNSGKDENNNTYCGEWRLLHSYECLIF